MPEDGKFVFESLQDRETIQEYLRALIDGINKGQIILSTDGEQIVLHPSELVRFSVKVKKKGGSNVLTMKVSWKDQNGEPDGIQRIKISS